MKPHLEIVVDSNEASKKKKYIDYLRRKAKELGQTVHIYQMSVGDIRIGDVVIEYKTPQDLLSYQDGTLRVWNQVKRLTELEKQGVTVVIAIVGNFGSLVKRHGVKKFYGRTLPQFYGVINSIQWKYHVPIVQFKDVNNFQIWLNGILIRQTRGRGLVTYSLRHTPSRIKGIKEEIHYILQGFKGLGGAKTDKILNSGGANLLDILCEIAVPIYMDEIGSDILEQSANIIKKWEDLLGKKTYQHLQDVLSYELDGKK